MSNPSPSLPPLRVAEALRARARKALAVASRDLRRRCSLDARIPTDVEMIHLGNLAYRLSACEVVVDASRRASMLPANPNA
jgi:hypothetical protein